MRDLSLQLITPIANSSHSCFKRSPCLFGGPDGLLRQCRSIFTLLEIMWHACPVSQVVVVIDNWVTSPNLMVIGQIPGAYVKVRPIRLQRFIIRFSSSLKSGILSESPHSCSCPAIVLRCSFYTSCGDLCSNRDSWSGNPSPQLRGTSETAVMLR